MLIRRIKKLRWKKFRWNYVDKKTEKLSHVFSIGRFSVMVYWNREDLLRNLLTLLCHDFCSIYKPFLPNLQQNQYSKDYRHADLWDYCTLFPPGTSPLPVSLFLFPPTNQIKIHNDRCMFSSINRRVVLTIPWILKQNHHRCITIYFDL